MTDMPYKQNLGTITVISLSDIDETDYRFAAINMFNLISRLEKCIRKYIGILV